MKYSVVVDSQFFLIEILEDEKKKKKFEDPPIIDWNKQERRYLKKNDYIVLQNQFSK